MAFQMVVKKAYLRVLNLVESLAEKSDTRWVEYLAVKMVVLSVVCSDLRKVYQKVAALVDQ